MNLQVIEVVVKCRVPTEEVEDHIIKLRRGDEILPVPGGLICRDAFECCEQAEAETTVVHAGYW